MALIWLAGSISFVFGWISHALVTNGRVRSFPSGRPPRVIWLDDEGWSAVPADVDTFDRRRIQHLTVDS